MSGWSDETPLQCDFCECALCDQDEWCEFNGDIACETCAIQALVDGLTAAYDAQVFQ